MGLCAKIWDCLCSAVVPQVINPKRAAAQNSSHPFPIGLIAFSGRIRAPYKILSRSVQKQKSYSISIFALIAPQDLSESGKVRNSWYNTNVVRPADTPPFRLLLPLLPLFPLLSLRRLVKLRSLCRRAEPSEELEELRRGMTNLEGWDERKWDEMRWN